MVSIEISDAHTKSTFQAFVQAVIPPQAYYLPNSTSFIKPGAFELQVYEYLMQILNQSMPLKVKKQLMIASMAKSTAELLDSGAVYLVQSQKNIYPLCCNTFPEGGPYTLLAPLDRLNAISYIERLEINPVNLKPPYDNNPGLIQNIVDVLHQLTFFGFYSEWTGYGSTTFLPPENRQMEYFPVAWHRAGYPGPAYAYRDFRGFLALMPHKKEG
ncbi:hypothetical protein [Niallia sp. BSM11]|uniref:hypothetical protein n=1 Tax=Niallia sp. BSM11 TaxID=3391576 RepID=UPI003984C5EF